VKRNSAFSALLVLLCALTLLAFGLRTYRLDSISLRGDESFTVLFVEKSFAQMWHEILTVEPNPPLLYLLLRGWMALAGAGEFATRYFSLFWAYCVCRSFTVWRAPCPHLLCTSFVNGGGLGWGRQPATLDAQPR